jgi:murein DD-endopeptidase MepM/ murein hydrolase activator NlpD
MKTSRRPAARDWRPGSGRHHHKRTKIRIFASAIIVVAVVAAILITGKKKPPPIEPEPAVAPSESESLALKTSEQVIRSGQTLSDILTGRNFTPEEIHRMKEQVKPVFNLNKIITGRRMRFTVDAAGITQSLEYSLDDKRYLTITREGSGFKAAIKEYPFETRTAFIWGTIEDNPINSFRQKNEKDVLAIRMTDLFAWDIDFYTELRQGDSFRMIYEKRFLEGRFVDYGEILAAEFICQGKKFQAFRFEYADTKKSDHFDRNGKSVRKEFLRSPLPYARITSRFSSRRLHPIRKVYRAHYGVDYGAPIGTPVQATGDGIVTFAGWSGASGRMVRIRHKNNYETMYLHLQKIYVKKGDRVTGGKTIIGTVGSSGESTGPHLDYRIKQGGSYVNPLSWKFLPVAPLRPEFKDAFKKEVEKYEILLDAPLMLNGPSR